ncbi:hypothetical protein MRX96_008219 [Rhipicephalus microplus]
MRSEPRYLPFLKKGDTTYARYTEPSTPGMELDEDLAFNAYVGDAETHSHGLGRVQYRKAQYVCHYEQRKV